jgi:hypothetical protein
MFSGGAGGSSLFTKSNAMSGIPILGGILGGVGSIAQGMQEGQELDNRATIYDQQAQLDRYNAGVQVQHTQDLAVRTMTSQIAAAGGSGITSAGSPMVAVRDTINRANAQDVRDRWLGDIRSSADLYQASLARWSASQARTAGMMNGIMDFGTAGLSGASIFA